MLTSTSPVLGASAEPWGQIALGRWTARKRPPIHADSLCPRQVDFRSELREARRPGPWQGKGVRAYRARTCGPKTGSLPAVAVAVVGSQQAAVAAACVVTRRVVQGGSGRRHPCPAWAKWWTSPRLEQPYSATASLSRPPDAQRALTQSRLSALGRILACPKATMQTRRRSRSNPTSDCGSCTGLLGHMVLNQLDGGFFVRLVPGRH